MTFTVPDLAETRQATPGMPAFVPPAAKSGFRRRPGEWYVPVMVWIVSLPQPDPPAVAPLQPESSRPRFSVMVPTYDPDAGLLQQALESVLAQNIPPETMQITVVDDTRRPGTTTAIVRAIDPHGRIQIVENERRLGIAGNWNRSLEQARGELVHLLHQDDFVLPGFYDRIDAGFRQAPHVGMGVCRSRIIDGKGRHVRSNSRLRWTSGTLHNWLPRIAIRQRVQTPAVVVRRSVYEAVGGFRTDLCQALDWEMWVRIAARYSVWYEPRTLAVYRRHRGNESSRLLARNHVWPDLARAIRINSASLPATSRDALITASAAWYGLSGLRTAERQLRRGDLDAAAATVDAMEGLFEMAAGGLQAVAVQRRLAAVHRRLLAAPQPGYSIGLRPAA
jgi:glycosyltransferase involved in cell wall biosynthesis